MILDSGGHGRPARGTGVERDGTGLVMDVQLRERLRRLVASGEDPAAGATPRLADDAERLWGRVRKFAALGMADIAGEADALELACFALQLPLRQRKPLPAGKSGRTSLKDRAEQAAELLVSQLGGEADEAVLDRATRVLQELPQKSPALDGSRLLADAVNLDDFGVTGLLALAVQLGLQGGGVA